MLKRHSNYKDSGIEWIGDIPRHWQVKSLKRFARICGGEDQKAVIDEDGSYPIYGSGGIFGRANKYLYDKESVLLGRKGTIDRPVYVAEPFWTVDTAFYTEINNDTNPKFFYYLCTTINFELYKYGSAIPSMSRETLNSIKFASPDLKEQWQVAKYLDHKTAQIDKLVSDKEKLVELLNEERIAVINQAVTKGIEPNSPMKNSGIELFREIPKHWQIKKLKFVAKIVLGKMLTNDDKGGYSLKPYLRAKNIGWFDVNSEDIKTMWFSSSELHQYRVKRNDLLISEGGEVGRTSIWKDELDECYIQNSVHKVTLNDDCNPEFFLYLFYFYGLKGHFDAIVNRISIAHLTKEKLSDVQFAVPPRHEQDMLTSRIKTEWERITNLSAKIQKEILHLKEYKTALISEVVTGKIDVRHEIIEQI